MGPLSLKSGALAPSRRLGATLEVAALSPRLKRLALVATPPERLLRLPEAEPPPCMTCSSCSLPLGERFPQAAALGLLASNAMLSLAVISDSSQHSGSAHPLPASSLKNSSKALSSFSSPPKGQPKGPWWSPPP